MSILAWIIVTSLFGGMLSVLFAAALTLNTRVSWVQMLVSYAIGALLGAAFLNALPEALELSKNPAQMTGTVLFGILLFFILEKLVLWRHCHAEECEAHDRLPGAAIVAAPSHDQHDHGRSGMMIMLGDTFHNFVDGILIAAAFMADVQLGIVTSIAIIAQRRHFARGIVDLFHVARHEPLHPLAAGAGRGQHDLCGNVGLDSRFA